MHSPLPRPDRDRLSAMTALVLLTYGLVRVIQLPTLQGEFAVLGLIIRLNIDASTFMVLLAGALATTGADWLVRSHPNAEDETPGAEHRIVPGIGALGAGAILTRLPSGASLALGLLAAGVVLAAIFWAEFVVFDRVDPRYSWAALGLRTLSFLLLVGAFVTIRLYGLRAVFAIPLVFVTTTAIAWRWLMLEGYARTAWPVAPSVGWIVAQLAWSTHYWPLSPVRGALIWGAVAYLGLGVALGHLAARLDRSLLFEVALVALGAVAIILFTT